MPPCSFLILFYHNFRKSQCNNLYNFVDFDCASNVRVKMIMEVDGMKIGIPREIKNNENRVGLSARVCFSRKWTYCFSGNKCGLDRSFEDVDYKEAGAEIVAEQAKVGMWIWLLKLKNLLNQNIHILKKD